MYKSAIVLAAGQGTRIKSKIPKVLHKVCGKEMVNHVIDIISRAGVEDINLIVGKGAELVKEHTFMKQVSYSLQEEQLGTGHAVKCAKDFLKGKSGVVAVFCGDTPLIKQETVEKLFNFHIENNNSITIVTSILDDATGYGRIVRDGDNVLKIVEHKDCTEEELKITEMNAGIYCFDIESLLESLDNLSNDNAQGEYYLTDVVGMQKCDGKKIGAMVIDFEETVGVNSRQQLAQAEKILRVRINNKHMDNGVTLVDPESTCIGPDVVIGQDTIIYPYNVIEGKTIIRENCIIYPNCRIKDSLILDGAKVSGITIEDSFVLENSNIETFNVEGLIKRIDKRLSMEAEVKLIKDQMKKMNSLG